MRCGGEGVGLEGTLEFVLEGTLGFVEVVGAVADAAVAGAAVAAVAEHPEGGRRRRGPRSGPAGKPAMWVVAGIAVGLEIIQQLFSRQGCRINEIESIYLAD